MASRAQADKARYRTRMKRVVETTPNLAVLQAEIVDLVCSGGRVAGVRHGPRRDQSARRRSVLTTARSSKD
jgi:tRNA uridine 5-carboxymethylaminomethyl modification enzyme